MDEGLEERLSALDDRIDGMEARILAALEGRMNSLESRLFDSPPPARQVPRFESTSSDRPVPRFEQVTGPPPIARSLTPPPTPPVEPPTEAARAERSETPDNPPSVRRMLPPTDEAPPPHRRFDENRAELQFGKIALPLLAAVLIAVGMITLASELIKRGVLTPPVQFGACIVATLALLGVGFWAERKEKLAGQLLLGLGALGGYLTAGAGHSTFHLYSDNVALGAFFVWAMIVLGFGFTRTSRPFTWLGLIGGMVAAVLARSDPNVSLALGAITYVVGGAMALRHRWPEVVGGAYAMATFALAFAAKGQPTPILMAFGEAALGTYALHSLLEGLNRPLVALPAAAGTLFVWLYAAATRQLDGGWVAALLAIWGLASAFVGWKEKDEPTRWMFGTIGFVAAGLIAPGTLPLAARTWIWSIAAAVAAGFCLFRPSTFAAALLGIWMITLIAGRLAFPAPMSLPDAAFWPMLAVLHFGLLRVYLRHPVGEASSEAVLFLAVTFPLLGLAILSVLSAVTGLSHTNASTLALAGGSFSLMTIGFRADRLGARYAAWVGLVLTVTKYFFIDLSEVDVLIRVAALFAIGIAAFLAGAVYQRRAKEEGTGEGS